MPYDPDGTWLHYYRRFESTEGDTALFGIPFAHSERMGAWTLRVTDLASGNETELQVDLR